MNQHLGTTAVSYLAIIKLRLTLIPISNLQEVRQQLPKMQLNFGKE